MKKLRENTNDRERAAYNQRIMEKESQLDKMKENRKEVENSLYQLDEDFRRGFHQLRMLSDENIREVQTGVFQEDQRNEALERFSTKSTSCQRTVFTCFSKRNPSNR